MSSGYVLEYANKILSIHFPKESLPKATMERSFLREDLGQHLSRVEGWQISVKEGMTRMPEKLGHTWDLIGQLGTRLRR
jgi:hypothetical protein